MEMKSILSKLSSLTTESAIMVGGDLAETSCSACNSHPCECMDYAEVEKPKTTPTQLNVTQNIDAETGEKTLTVSALNQDADELMMLLQNAGMLPVNDSLASNPASNLQLQENEGGVYKSCFNCGVKAFVDPQTSMCVDCQLSAEEQQELDEAADKPEMTPAQMQKREEIVKAMKKDITGMKERYGKRWKEVMYRTATKKAQELVSESNLLECEMPSPEDTFSVNLNWDATGKQNINVNASGTQAQELMRILHLAGMVQAEKPAMENLANSPDPDTAKISTITTQGADLHGPHKQVNPAKHMGNADNGLTMMSEDSLVNESINAMSKRLKNKLSKLL